MDFTTSIKSQAQQIITLSSQLGDRTHTWNDEESAPAGGYTDRAGFIVSDDIELFADVYTPQDDPECLLRIRLALSPKAESTESDTPVFTIITLDFRIRSEAAKAIIADAAHLQQQALVELLNNPDTAVHYAHVSLESGVDPTGQAVGQRYEYDAEELEHVSDADRTALLDTLTQAYEQIVSKV